MFETLTQRNARAYAAFRDIAFLQAINRLSKRKQKKIKRWILKEIKKTRG